MSGVTQRRPAVVAPGSATGEERLLAGLALLAWLVARVAPSTAAVLTEVAVVAVLALSLELSLRRLGAPVLLQPGALALGAWFTGWLLAHNQSPIVAVALALLAAAVAGGVFGALPGLADHRRLALGGAALGVGLATLVPPVPNFPAPLLLGVALATPLAALVLALAGLFGAAHLLRRVERGELGRWLAVAVTRPDLVARSGVDPRTVRMAGLALCAGLAGLAGAALALASLGHAAGRQVDAELVLGWLLAPLAAPLLGGGRLGLIAGAALYIGLAQLASAVGLHPLSFTGLAAAALLLLRGRGR